MLRVVRNHRRAAYNAPRERVRGPDDHAGRHRRTLLPRLPARGGPPRMRPHARAGREARLSQRPGHVHRADRHHRPGHGLRHHRRRAGLRPGQVQEAGRRRLLQDHQRLDPAGPRPARLHAASRSKTSSATAAGPARSHGCPHINRASLQGQGLPRRRAASASRRMLPGVFELPFVFNRWTVGDDFLRDKLGFTEEQIDAPELRPADGPRLHARRRSPRPTPTSAAP